MNINSLATIGLAAIIAFGAGCTRRNRVYVHNPCVETDGTGSDGSNEDNGNNPGSNNGDTPSDCPNLTDRVSAFHSALSRESGVQFHRLCSDGLLEKPGYDFVMYLPGGSHALVRSLNPSQLIELDLLHGTERSVFTNPHKTPVDVAQVSPKGNLVVFTFYGDTDPNRNGFKLDGYVYAYERSLPLVQELGKNNVHATPHSTRVIEHREFSFNELEDGLAYVLHESGPDFQNEVYAWDVRSNQLRLVSDEDGNAQRVLFANNDLVVYQQVHANGVDLYAANIRTGDKQLLVDGGVNLIKSAGNDNVVYTTKLDNKQFRLNVLTGDKEEVPCN